MEKININNFDEKLYFYNYDGLKVYLIPNKTKDEYIAYFGTHFGSNDIEFTIDKKKVKVPTGTAHFLEHKIFDRKENPFDFYSKIGCDVNAFTSKDITCFYFSGTENFKKGFEYLLDFVTDFKISKEKVEKERQIILEESNMYKDNPYDVLENIKNENLFIKHPYKYKTIGSDEDILSISKQDLDICYDSFYRRDNMFIVIVGNFNIKDANNIIKNISFNTSSKNINKITYNEPDYVNKKGEYYKHDVEIPIVSISYKINKKIYEELGLNKYFTEYYLNMFLSLMFGSLSDFNEEYYKKGLFYTLNYSEDFIGDHYILSIKSKTKNPEKFIDTLDKYIRNKKFTEEEFERIKKLWISSEIRIIDNIKATAYNIIDDLNSYNEFKNNKVFDIKSLSFKEFNKVINKLDLNNISKVVILRKE